MYSYVNIYSYINIYSYNLELFFIDTSLKIIEIERREFIINYNLVSGEDLISPLCICKT